MPSGRVRGASRTPRLERQNPRFASPRTRPERPDKAGGMGGQSFFYPPLFPGLLGPLEAAVGGRAGEGRTPDPDPGLPPHPLTAYLSTPGRPLSPCLSLRGLCGDPRGSAATPCGPAPAPSPSGAFPCAKGNFREGEGPAPPAEGASGSPPLEPQPQMNRRGQDFYSSRSFSTPTRTLVLMRSWPIPVASSMLSNWTFS